LSRKLSQSSDLKGEIIESKDSDYAYRMVVQIDPGALYG